MKAQFTSLASFVLLSAFARAQSTSNASDVLQSLKLAPTQVDRIKILDQDSDFVFNFLGSNGAVTSSGGSVTAATVSNFGALVGNGMAMAVGMLHPCSIVMPHTHPRATEFVLVLNGTIEAGFLAENGARFVSNNVTALSATIFPKGSIHFEANLGCEPVAFVGALNDEDPGVLVVTAGFFGLPADIVSDSLGGLGVQQVQGLENMIPQELVVAAQQCFATCGITPPPSQNPPPPSMTGSGTGSNSSTTAPANHDVIVGFNDTLTYNPSNITASIGDTVTFHYMPKNHTATQSAFDEPCVPLPGGFDSGFHPVSANSSDPLGPFTITVNDTNPIWVFCRQTGHCGKGMVFSVNAPLIGDHTFQDFKNLAMQINGTGSTTVESATATDSATWTDSSATTDASTTSWSAEPTTTSTGKNWDVVVGANGQLTYTPDSVEAAVGDTVTYHFVERNHTATQAAFASPCSPLASGFDSGFEPTSDGKLHTFTITVNDTKPIWVYCAQTVPSSHCHAGMVSAINAPKTGNTLDKFRAEAEALGKQTPSNSHWFRA